MEIKINKERTSMKTKQLNVRRNIIKTNNEIEHTLKQSAKEKSEQ